jgi:ribonucleoside-diphosphate reductase alpha chain
MSDIRPDSQTIAGEVEKSWRTLDEYLTATRYAVRDPKTGEPLEADYQTILAGRIIPKLAGLDSPIKDPMMLDELVKALLTRQLIPASPLLMSFGNPHTRRQGYFSCYPLGWVGDSLTEIEDIRHKMRTIYMAGGGAGIDVSKLRQKGAPVDAGQGIASGPVGFLQDFDAVTGTTNQGGRRRGALLVQMDWNHPDIKDFVQVKNFNSKLNRFIQSLPAEERPAQSPHLSNMNISVNAFGEFWQDNNLVKLIAENMWATGDPGLLFVDNMLKYSPLKSEDEPRFSNPCGEYLASAGTACNLITVNAARLAREAYDQLTGEGLLPTEASWTVRFCEIFWTRLGRVSALACYLGNLILEFDEGYPLEEIKVKTKAKKPVGVGMSGFHTALILAYWGNKFYGEEQAAVFAKETQAALTLGTLTLSASLARKTGHVYESADYWTGHLNELYETLSESAIGPVAKHTLADLTRLVEEKGGFYNCLTTSQAPTGSVSAFLRNIDTGIEPFYALSVDRRVRDAQKGWITFTLKPVELSALFEKYPDLLERAEAQTALKLSPKEQIQMLAAFQYHNHTGVSKTVNLPAEATAQEIEELIILSRDLRLKGFTVYRDSSLEGIISVSSQESRPPKEDSLSVSSVSEPEPDIGEERESRTFTAKSGSLNAHITLTNDALNNIREVFVAAGDVGADINAIFTAFGMILSVALRRYPTLFEPLVKVLCKVKMDQRVVIRTNMSHIPIVGNSLPQAIGLLMLQRKKYMDTGRKVDVLQGHKGGFDLCPECQQLALRREGSCRKCCNCGFTTC